MEFDRQQEVHPGPRSPATMESRKEVKRMKRLPAFMLLVVLAATPVLALAARININTDSAKTLEQLEGVGPVKARAIVAYRKSDGGFESVDELKDVQGIGPATVEANRSRISLQ
jgi:competence protein ComEA